MTFRQIIGSVANVHCYCVPFSFINENIQSMLKKIQGKNLLR